MFVQTRTRVHCLTCCLYPDRLAFYRQTAHISSASSVNYMLPTVLILVFSLHVCATPTRQCPIGDKRGGPNASCTGSAVCALFDGRSSTCVGWATYRCSRAQYRDLTTCECKNCPKGSGDFCSEDNECCALVDCDRGLLPAPATTPKPTPRALSAASRPSSHTLLGVLLAVSLTLMCQGTCIAQTTT